MKIPMKQQLAGKRVGGVGTHYINLRAEEPTWHALTCSSTVKPCSPIFIHSQYYRKHCNPWRRHLGIGRFLRLTGYSWNSFSTLFPFLSLYTRNARGSDFSLVSFISTFAGLSGWSSNTRRPRSSDISLVSFVSLSTRFSGRSLKTSL